MGDFEWVNEVCPRCNKPVYQGDWDTRCRCNGSMLRAEIELLHDVLRLFEVTHTIQEFGGDEAHMAFFAKDCALEITPDHAAAVLRALGQDISSNPAGDQ